jgi:hypothetical protein
LVPDNVFEPPDNVIIFLILLDEVHEFIVHDDFLLLVIIDGDPKLMMVI